jgi:hypothetical protein
MTWGAEEVEIPPKQQIHPQNAFSNKNGAATQFNIDESSSHFQSSMLLLHFCRTIQQCNFKWDYKFCFLDLDSQPLGPLEVDQPQTALHGDLVEGLVSQQGLIGCPGDVVVVPAPVGLGNDVGNPHHLEDLAAEGIPAKTVRRWPQYNLARVLPPDQIAGEGPTPKPVDKEDVPLGHPTGNLDGILRLKGLPEAEPTAAAEVSAND